MFRTNHYSCPPVPRQIFEDLSGREVYHHVIVDELDENGDNKRRYELRKRLTSTPFTPQSGVDCKVNDLSFMLNLGMKISHEPAMLSVAGSGNPFVEAQFVKSLAKDVERTFESQTKKDE